jgi:hypothetical protein
VAVALVLVSAWRARERGWRPRGLAAGAGLLALMHLVVAPLLWPTMTLALRQLDVQVERMLQPLHHELDWKRLPEQRVVVIPIPHPPLGLYVPIVMALRGMPKPRSWWQLSLSPEPQELTRTGPASLELSLPRGHFLTSEFEGVFRGTKHPLPREARVELKGMTVTVLDADAEGPTRLGFEFDTPLESPSFVFLGWKDDALRPITLPPVGERLTF